MGNEVGGVGGGLIDKFLSGDFLDNSLDEVGDFDAEWTSYIEQLTD